MTMHNRLLIALVGTLLLLPGLCVGANSGGPLTRYKWKDAQGAVHFADTLPAEALQVGYDVVDSQGIVVKHVDRARTAEERKADAAAAEVEAARKQKELNAYKADQQLLVAYSSEQDLAAAQKAKIDSIDQSIQNVRMSQADQEKSLSEQLSHADTFERSGKPIPAIVQQQIDALKKNIDAQRVFIEHKEHERAETELKSEAELAHYRELKAKKAEQATQ